MDRRTQIEDKYTELELQTYNLNYDRWDYLYKDSVLGSRQHAGDIGEAFGGEQELPVTDLADLDAWYETLGTARGINGRQAAAFEDRSLYDQASSDPDGGWM